MKTSKGVFLIGVLLLVPYTVVFAKPSPVALAVAPKVEELVGDSITVHNVVAVTNKFRYQQGIEILKQNEYLTSIAQHKAEDLATHSLFQHRNSFGRFVWQETNDSIYNYEYMGENLAARFDSVSKMESAWEASPSHKENILGKHYQDIGVGIAKGIYKGKQETFVVVVFANKI